MINMIQPGTAINIAFITVILLFGGVLAFYLIRQIHLPLELAFTKLDEAEISDEEREMFERLNREVADAGFESVALFTVPGLAAANVNRLYSNKNHDTRLVASRTTYRGRDVTFIEFVTVLESGQRLHTTNIPRASYLALPDWYEVERHTDLSDAQQLFDIHKASVEREVREGARVKGFPPDALPKDIIAEQKKLMDYQVETRRFRVNEEKSRYQGTWRIATASMAFFADPRTSGISGKRSAAAVITGLITGMALVLLFRCMELDSLLAESFQTVIPSKLAFLAYCVPFIAAGSITGWVMPNRGFAWAFVAALPVMFILPADVGSKIFLPLVSGQTAMLVNRLRETFSGRQPGFMGAVIVLFGLIFLGYSLAS